MQKPELFFNSPACDIFFNKELNAVQTEWRDVFFSANDYKLILNKITELLKNKSVSLVIADARKMKIISPDLREWTIKEWYPEIVKAGFSSEVLIVTHFSFNENSIKKIVHNYDDKKVKTIYFYSAEEAFYWLKENYLLLQ